ncbi:aldo/keto reductase [Demequina sp. NBRC 110056]|uniref:aldo/keto reductase n=1 Tax=Demequina sp. NBRC 110056 TaxID=1570345 RepID=UPI000A06B210|nr:aldo/keto reductase [Demequina sp. NBRC 110056]
MNPAPTIALSDGSTLPSIGFGVFQVTDVDQCEASVAAALDAGYRLLDTAAVYRNERAVGRGVRASGVSRDEVVVTTKLWPADFGRRTPRAIERSLERLGTGHIDLMLLHRPHGDVAAAWRALEDAVDRGQIRSIGVSNFSVRDLTTLMAGARIRPAVNQVEFHPYWQQTDLLPFLAAEGIVPQAWYPLAHGARQLLDEPALRGIAERLGVSEVQVVLRWHVQRDVVPLPKSTSPAHIASNLDVFGFELSPEDMAAIDGLGRDRPLYRVPRWVDAITTRLPTPPALQ